MGQDLACPDFVFGELGLPFVLDVRALFSLGGPVEKSDEAHLPHSLTHCALSVLSAFLKLKYSFLLFCALLDFPAFHQAAA